MDHLSQMKSKEVPEMFVIAEARNVIDLGTVGGCPMADNAECCRPGQEGWPQRPEHRHPQAHVTVQGQLPEPEEGAISSTPPCMTRQDSQGWQPCHLLSEQVTNVFADKKYLIP